MNTSTRAAFADEPSGLVRALGALSLQDALQAGYLVFLLVAVYRGAGPTRSDALQYLTLDLVAFGLAVVAWRGVMAPPPAARVVYNAATCLPVLATFAQLHHILPAATDLRLDASLLAVDARVLGYEPSIEWDALVTPAATEWWSFFYLGYFVVLGAHIAPMMLFERRAPLLAEFSLGLIAVYCIGQALYVVVPAYGPWVHLAGRFHHTLEGDFWYPLMRRIVASGGPRTDVFPSLHTAGPTFIALFSFRHRRARPFNYTWPLVAFVASQIIVATMYLRWHYLIDVVAGLTLAAAASWWSSRVTTRSARQVGATSSSG